MHENTTVLATFVQLISAPWKEYISDISVGVKVIREITYASDYGGYKRASQFRLSFSFHFLPHLHMDRSTDPLEKFGEKFFDRTTTQEVKFLHLEVNSPPLWIKLAIYSERNHATFILSDLCIRNFVISVRAILEFSGNRNDAWVFF